MAPHTTTLTARRNLVIRRHLTTLALHVILGAGSEFLLSLVGFPLPLRIVVEVATLAATRWRKPW